MSLDQFKPDINLGSHAIVIGGSIAGLLSARILAEKFASVTLVERDELPSKPDARKGVPQSVQPHTLLVKGYRLLKDLFPDIEARLTERGALKIDWAREFHLFDKLGWKANSQTQSNIISVTCSRPLLEWAIRQELSTFKNVDFIEGHRVTGLIYASEDKRVKGVRLRSTISSAENELLANLVVDASGRSSNAPEWLKSIGLTPPPETIVNPFLGYASRLYREPEGFRADWKIMLTFPVSPNSTRLGYLAKIENGEWIATLGGYAHDFPPIDNEGFLKFAHSLPSPRFYQAISQAEPVSPIYAHRATANRLRHYEKVTLPQGFIALGDAVCALCPFYGQGITVSALGAMVLRNQLQIAPAGELCVNSFQQSLAESNSPHWNLATQSDSRFPETRTRSELVVPITSEEERREPGMVSRALKWYIERLFTKTTTDASLNTLSVEIINLLKGPTAFFHPLVILKVLWP